MFKSHCLCPAGEQEDTVSADQEFAEQLDKEMNATPQRHSSQCKKVTPQKKMPTKPAALKQKQVSNPTSKQQVSNPTSKQQVSNPSFEGRGVEQ